VFDWQIVVAERQDAAPRTRSTWWLAVDALVLAAMLFVVQRFVFHRGGHVGAQIAIDLAVGAVLFVVLLLRRRREQRSVPPAA
jgi:hypothetical protein